MPLSKDDIRRIERLGFRREEFVRVIKVKSLRKIFVLKNKDGKCVFLSKDGMCKIYKYRPKGCKLYPLVYNLDKQKVELDDLCKYRNEFKVNDKDIEELLELIKEVVDVEESNWNIGENRKEQRKRGNKALDKKGW